MSKNTEGKFKQFSASDAFVAYSLPGSKEHLLISGDVNDKLSSKGSFIIQRFDKREEKPFYLEASEIRENQPFYFDFNESSSLLSTTIKTYLKSVNETIEAIRNGHFQKVVMSKIKVIKTIDHNSKDSFFSLFEILKLMYPDAFVFLYHIPGEGCWCGATPEILLDFRSDVVSTMALAGTKVDSGIPLDQVVWGTKEIEEQKIIEDFVVDILSRNRIESTKIGPETMKAGSVLHIKSIFKMPAVLDPINLADELHPGPAICGIPLESSRVWIKDKEEHDREHYCGYIGPWNICGKSNLFINLRSMRIFTNQFVLFLGGGLTAQSVASSEWEETELKSQTLVSAIEKLAVNG